MTAAYWLGWVAGFACGAVGIAFLNTLLAIRRNRALNKVIGDKFAADLMDALHPQTVYRPDVSAMQASTQGIQQGCGDPDCPTCGSGQRLFTLEEGQAARVVLPEKDTKN